MSSISACVARNKRKQDDVKTHTQIKSIKFKKIYLLLFFFQTQTFSRFSVACLFSPSISLSLSLSLSLCLSLYLYVHLPSLSLSFSLFPLSLPRSFSFFLSHSHAISKFTHMPHTHTHTHIDRITHTLTFR